jgi:hypothetical protein
MINLSMRQSRKEFYRLICEVWAVLRVCELYPSICLTAEEKARKNLRRAVEQCPDIPALREPGQNSVSVDICRVAHLSGSPHQLTWSGISQVSDVVGEVGDSQIIVNLPVPIVPWCTGSNAKTFGLQRLQLLDMGASGGLPDRTCVVHHRTD